MRDPNRSTRLARGVAGVALYVGFVALPLLVLLLVDRPPGRSFLREFSVALAFAALVMLGLQFALTARFRRLKAPYGIDVVYHFHREISLVIVALIATHVTLLVLDDPATLELLAVWSAPLRARFAVAAFVATVALLGLSFWRARVGLRYEPWRATHGALGVLVIACAVAHVELVGYYVNTPLKREIWIIYPALWVALLGWVRVVKPMVMSKRPWRVSSVSPERGAATTLRLEPVGHQGLRYDPGQFVWLTLGVSPFGMREHPFSVSSAPDGSGAVELTVKALGDFTSTIAETPVGERAYVDGPYGSFSIDRHPAERYVFIAGGVGITPIIGNLRAMRERADRRPVTLVYGAASLEAMTFREELHVLAEEIDLRLIEVPAEAPSGWAGASGRITREVLASAVVEPFEIPKYFVCGPEPMMTAVSKDLQRIGVPVGRIHYELFNLA